MPSIQGADLGKLASYIPELTLANPDHFGIALTTADGQIYDVGNSDVMFTIQSISKPLVYGLALEDHGSNEVLRKVGVEPTGEAFNSIVMDEVNNRPSIRWSTPAPLPPPRSSRATGRRSGSHASSTCSVAMPAAS